MLQRLNRRSKNYRPLMILGCFALMIYSLLGLAVPTGIKIIIDRALPTRDSNLLILVIAGLIMIYALRSIVGYIAKYLVHYGSQRILFDLRRDLVVHLQNLSMDFFDATKSGKLVARIINDVGKVQALINQGLNNVVVNLFAMAVILVILVAIDPWLTAISLIPIPILVGCFIHFKNLIEDQSKELQEKMSVISGDLSESINGIRVVKALGRGPAENLKMTGQFKELFHLQMNLHKKNLMCMVTSECLCVAATLLAIGMGTVRVWDGAMSIGTFVAFYSYLGMLINPINVITNFAPVLGEGLAGLHRIFELLDTQATVKPGKLPASTQHVGKIEFKGVDFAYKIDQPVLHNFSLSVQPGQTVALVGESGSGKSTIATLLLRFYDPIRGCIEIDGQNIRNIRSNDYRDRVGIVLQEAFLFTGTVYDNIAYGKAGATSEEIIAAAKIANAHRFIEGLELGYQTIVGERGTGLSGGQKQRIAIARTLLRNPDILILDEATSALDNTSEREVQRALDNLHGRRTTLIIAHRLTTIQNADSIVVMEKGRIAEVGNHEELLRQKGIYARLYYASLDKDEPTSKKLFSTITPKNMPSVQELAHA